ncbi:MAG: VWA domain-containing protein [Propionibacteriaceae bacterium]|nr:VWA domain-containing protein [Propionibacteriaceae bacterium]
MTPSRLWILVIIPVLIAAYILIIRRKSRQGMRYTDTTILGQVLPKQSQWLRHIIVSLALLSLIALSFAWARPEGTDKVPRESATVVLILDVSMSMTATDVPPSRLENAKKAAIDFIGDLPDEFNVALVSLSGTSMLLAPPTTEHDGVIRIIQNLQPQESSAIGDAISTALVGVQQGPKANDGEVSAMIVLLSDGANTNGQAPLMAAQDAKDMGVPIYTIAFGTDNGYVDYEDERHQVPPDINLMKQIADETGGKEYSADNVSQLNRAYDDIHSSLGYVETKKEITANFIALCLVFAFAASVGAVLMGVRFR